MNNTLGDTLFNGHVSSFKRSVADSSVSLQLADPLLCQGDASTVQRCLVRQCNIIHFTFGWLSTARVLFGAFTHLAAWQAKGKTQVNNGSLWLQIFTLVEQISNIVRISMKYRAFTGCNPEYLDKRMYGINNVN